MELPGRIEAFAKLGEYLRERLPGPGEIPLSPGIKDGNIYPDPELEKVTQEAEAANPWFIPSFIRHALAETGRLLERKNLEEWTGRYPRERFEPLHPRVVGTVLAGNIPLAGFHDFLSILVSGNRFRGKLSGKDDKLLPFLAAKLVAFEPRLEPFLHFEESRLGRIDAMIATGSNNSFRYFEYYFGKYPHIFRRNRNAAALLDGTETKEELEALADDVFLYFGMGCRNVAKLYVPEGYDFDGLFRKMEKYLPLIDHHKYANNYLYQRTVFLMNRVEHLDSGFLLVRPERALASPAATLHYETWAGDPHLPPGLQEQAGSIQCIAGRGTGGSNTEGVGVSNALGVGVSNALGAGILRMVPFGRTQYPELWDYADDVDTLKFLLNLYEN
jgi:hypothetical protein